MTESLEALIENWKKRHCIRKNCRTTEEIQMICYRCKDIEKQYEDLKKLLREKKLTLREVVRRTRDEDFEVVPFKDLIGDDDE